jgi:hypothetical protein
MIGIVRDTWRAVLILVVGAVLLEAASLRQPPPSVATQAPPPPPSVATGWHPQPIVIQQPASPPERPIRRVASAVMEMGDSVIGVFR